MLHCICCSLESAPTWRHNLASEMLNLTPKANMESNTSGSVNHLWTKHWRWDSQRMCPTLFIVFGFFLSCVADLFLYLVLTACQILVFFVFFVVIGLMDFFRHVFLCAPVVLDLLQRVFNTLNWHVLQHSHISTWCFWLLISKYEL